MTVGVVLAILVALAFALTNGFHDAADAIATLVATRVARPLQAVVLAAVFNLVGPFVIGSAVANTVARIIDVPPGQAVAVIGAGLERVYRNAMVALLEVDDVREVMGRRELYRRFSRVSESVQEVADRVWYATVKEA